MATKDKYNVLLRKMDDHESQLKVITSQLAHLIKGGSGSVSSIKRFYKFSIQLPHLLNSANVAYLWQKHI